MYRRACEREPPKTPRVAESQPLSPTRSLPRRHAFIHMKSTCPKKQKVRTQSRSADGDVDRENRVLFGLVRVVSRVDGGGLNLHPAGDVFAHEPLVASVEHVHIVNIVVELVV